MTENIECQNECQMFTLPFCKWRYKDWGHLLILDMKDSLISKCSINGCNLPIDWLSQYN